MDRMPSRTSRRRHAYWRYAEDELWFAGDRPG